MQKKVPQSSYSQSWWEVTWKNTLVTAAILAVVTLVAWVYNRISEGTVNIVMFYTVALIFIPRFTQGYVPGIVAAMISVGCVNYLFTYPYSRLDFTRQGYPVTFFCMLLIAVMVSAVTSYTKEQSRILAEQEKRLREAEKEKIRANLLRAISHDLRTPLTGIIGASSSYLENGELLSEEEKRKMVRHIGEDANWLLHMVENLLTVTRIQNDSAGVTKNMEAVEEVLLGAVGRIRKRIPDIRIDVRLPEEFVMLPMDAMLIEQVLVNLMENAWFHANSTKPILLYTQIGEKEVAFCVRDYGTGIAPNHLETIFDGEDRNGGGESDSHRGMGLGLSICKTIVMAHGGRILAHNCEQGAEICFYLPCQEQPASEAPERKRETAGD